MLFLRRKPVSVGEDGALGEFGCGDRLSVARSCNLQDIHPREPNHADCAAA